MFANHITTPLIIIGMHRSGTTMLAEALNSAGVFMGVFREHNGEALHFLSLNQQMLWAAGGDWLHPVVPTQAHDKTLPLYQIFAEHIKSQSSNALRLRVLHNRRWGFKDPRTTFTLPLWLKRFPKARVLHVVRDARAVVQSLQARNTIAGEVFDERLNDAAFCFSLWETYVKQGMSYKNELANSYLQVRYEDILAKSEQTLALLNRFCGVDVGPHLHLKKQKPQIFTEELNQLAEQSDLFKIMGYHL